MAALFLDSSALVKRYVRETGTNHVVNLTDPDAGNILFVARITGVEVVAALARRSREPGVEQPVIAAALANFNRDFPDGFLIVDLTPGLMDEALRMAEKHALRAYDSVQLAAAIFARSEVSTSGDDLVFLSADVLLNEAARREGFAVDDPGRHG